MDISLTMMRFFDLREWLLNQMFFTSLLECGQLPLSVASFGWAVSGRLISSRFEFSGVSSPRILVKLNCHCKLAMPYFGGVKGKMVNVLNLP